MHTYAQPTLLDVLSPRLSRPAAVARDVALAVAGTLLLTLSAKLQIPFWPVPMTMQTFVVLLLGTAFGWRLGAATVALYLVEGALGLPVFAGTPERGIGIAYMMGPTGGYLAGFLAAAVLCGRLAERGWDRDLLRAALAMTMGHLLILFLGWAWLAALIGPQKAYLTGVAPFYAATAAKTLLAVVALPLAWKLAGRRTSASRTSP
jgi:biotin transport system substrate-specific component